MRKAVELYTDGACSGNPGIGGWGVVLVYKEFRKEASGSEAETTNNRMELLAVIRGLSLLKEPCDVTVFSDSQYVVGAFVEGWVDDWQEKGWKKADKSAVKNVDLWQELLSEISNHTVKFVKVKGHADNELNNRCDKLATTAIKNRVSE